MGSLSRLHERLARSPQAWQRTHVVRGDPRDELTTPRRGARVRGAMLGTGAAPRLVIVGAREPPLPNRRRGTTVQQDRSRDHRWRQIPNPVRRTVLGLAQA